MEPIYSFHLPMLPPSLNSMYHPNGRGGIRKDGSVGDFEDAASGLLPRWPRDPISVPIRAELTFHIAPVAGKLGNRMNRLDGDNMEKALWDMLQHFEILKNDALVYECLRKKVPSDTDRTFVSLFLL